jgi:hypothetical protein
VGVVRIDPVTPKQACLWILLSFFLALAVWQPGHQTKDAKEGWPNDGAIEPVDRLLTLLCLSIHM